MDVSTPHPRGLPHRGREMCVLTCGFSRTHLPHASVPGVHPVMSTAQLSTPPGTPKHHGVHPLWDAFPSQRQTLLLALLHRPQEETPMTRLSATTTPTDHRRCSRLMIAWIDGDKLALDTVLDEAMSDPTGVPGLLFSLADAATDLGLHVAPDMADQLRASLLAETQGPSTP